MSKERQEFINKYSNDVIKATQGTGLFPSVKMAQFIIESANSKGQAGQGITFLKANNGFGIKADKNYKGAKMAFNTPKDGKPVSYFRVYSSPLDSIKDHTAFMLNNKRYTTHGVFRATTPEAQIDALAKAGYSESHTYATALKAMVNAYNLKQLDNKAPTATKSNNTAILFFLLAAGVVFYLDKNQ
jgi:flagellum-specific peptidoglycan hydrolase FlgJ